MQAPKVNLKYAILIPLGLFWSGFGIESERYMPDSAFVYVDPVSNVYFGRYCIPASYKSGPFPKLLEMPARAAWALEVEPDHDCIEEGAFYEDGRSVSGMLLEWVGVLGPLRSRWNADGTWNW